MSGRIIPFPGRRPEPERSPAFVEVFRARDQAEALVIQGLLRAHGITCLLRTTHLAPSVHPFTVGDLGEVRILVAEADGPESRLLLSRYSTGDHAFP
ncbi:MAG: DUF2007 domain-containing protein [Candidatus Rokubacteria bacterium]|nr:DUF2007 domain-containing protein [Candidatus Rokubacteria bacterium]